MQRKKQLYFKLFWMYATIVCFVVAVLMVYFVFAFKKNLLENRQQEAETICQNIISSLQRQKDVVDYLYSDLYRNRQELNDVLAYLELDVQNYWNHRLDQYSASNSANYASLQTFVDNAFEISEILDRIELISYTTMEMTICEKQAVIVGQDGRERMEKLENKKTKPGEIVFQREIRDPDTLQSKGCMVFTFQGNAILKYTTQSHAWLDVLVTQDYIHPVMNISGFERWKEYLLAEQNGRMPEMISYQMYQDHTENYQVFVFLNQIRASELSYQAILMIFGVGFAVLTSGLLCVSIYIKRLTHRVDAILAGMDAVKTGDLTVQLTIPQSGDELDMIASDFNDMCDKLREHIRCRYLAEIEKKTAELQAWQSQINPHFLYNTLEAIRMKAICNGDREIAKMLYSMSTLFRNQLKEDDWITVEQELSYCRQYLELFEYRYPGVFTYEIQCPAELLGCYVIKFILQPLLENYFIHGIRAQQTDNHIHIVVQKKEKDLIFRVIDNGRGMDLDEIKRRNIELQCALDHDKFDKKSIGVNNVNRRIQAVYGEGYGIQMQQVPGGGLEVCVMVAEREEA